MQNVTTVALTGSESRTAHAHEVPLVPSLGEPHRFIDVGHSRIAYWKAGTGPDVVFVHGWPLHSATFRGIVPFLARRFTCHLIDLPGSGHTVCTAESPLAFKAHATTVRRAVDELGLARYALVAHDSGGFVARLVASRDPRVTALVLGNTEVPGHVPWQIRFYAIAARLPFGASAVRLAMRSRLIRESSLAFGGCFSDRALLRGEFHTLFVEPILASAEYGARTLAPLVNIDLSDFDLLESLHRSIRAPVLLAWGDRDLFFPLERARVMRNQFAGPAELRVIEGAKLFAHEERPEEFGILARDFFLEHSGSEAKGREAC
jgi:haloalkane dehalogenase